MPFLYKENIKIKIALKCLVLFYKYILSLLINFK